MNGPTITDLFNAKVHFGHLKRFVSPKMTKYIYSIENKISIINLDLTLSSLKMAVEFLKNIVKNDGIILFVGTKKQAKQYIHKFSCEINMPHINSRWLGGILTNYGTIKKSIDKLKDLESQVNNYDFKYMTKKENLTINRKLLKLRLYLDGIKNMEKLPDVLFVVDVNHEKIAIKEANKLSIPVVGIVDTNSDPDGINYVIPGNDDSMESIKLYLSTITNSIKTVLDVKSNKKI